MKKIVIIGCGGSGKSTFSRNLGEVTRLPVYHLDALHWKPNWVATPDEEWIHLLNELIKKNEWIIDGNYGGTIDIRLSAADTIIFFDLPRWVPIFRLFKRRIMYHGRTRPDMTEGCDEKLDFQFIKWVWNFNRDKRPAIIEKLKKYAKDKNIIIFNKTSDAHIFIEKLNTNK